jgi:predicted dehydrogenase
MTKIKIGFLGAGYIAGVHAAILARDAVYESTGQLWENDDG